jgi:hypothetical protein
MDCNIPNAFIQALMPKMQDRDESVMMKITGVLVDMLVKLNPELYGPHVVYERNRKVLYAQVIRAIYGMLEAVLLWYKKFQGELEQAGFKLILMTHASQTKLRKEHSLRSFFMHMSMRTVVVTKDQEKITKFDNTMKNTVMMRKKIDYNKEVDQEVDNYDH